MPTRAGAGGPHPALLIANRSTMRKALRRGDAGKTTSEAPNGEDDFQKVMRTEFGPVWLGDLGATEMELAGVQKAAERLKKQTPIICIRGLSDIVGYKREGACVCVRIRGGILCVAADAYAVRRHLGII